MTRRIATIALSLLLGVSACGGGDDGEFSQEFRDSFMASCTADQSEGFCICYLDELQKRFTQEEIFRVAIEGGEEPPPEFFEAGFACAAQLDG